MTSSIANVIAAIGVLNAAAIPAAAPTEISALTTRDGRRVALPTAAPIAAQIWTVGPSRPIENPDPIESAPRTNLPTTVRSDSWGPGPNTYAVLTSGMPLPRANGTTLSSSSPTT